MMTEQTATTKKGGLRITIDWIDSDGDGDSDDASPNRGIQPPSSSRKGDELARSSHVRGGTCIHINVCLASPPSSAVKVKGDVSVDVRSSPNPGGDVCFVSPPPAAAKGKGRRDAAAKGTRRRDAATEADGELFSGMSDDELLREIAGLRNNTLRRFQPRFRFSVCDFYRTWAKWAKFKISDEFRKIADEKQKANFEI
jgi:hypothetical protein